MKGSVRFFIDYLVEDPATGYLISGPSVSPELGGVVMGPTMDHQIIRELFNNTIQASETLGVDAALRDSLVTLRDRIAPNQIGRLGQLQEWMEDIDDPNERHRHVSHLWGLHPGGEINAFESPDLFAAAQRSLEMRGDEGTGWSKAWKINFWARLHDGDRAHRLLGNLLTLTRGQRGEGICGHGVLLHGGSPIIGHRPARGVVTQRCIRLLHNAAHGRSTYPIAATAHRRLPRPIPGRRRHPA